MGWTRQLITAIRLDMVAQGIEPIVIGPMKTNTPDRALSLTPFSISRERTTGVTLLGLQVRSRIPSAAGSGEVMDLLDEVFEYFEGVDFRNYDGTIVSTVTRERSVPMGQDDVGRYEHADTYHLLTSR